MISGDRMKAAMALTDELIDSAAICTTPDGLSQRLSAYAEIGANTLVAIPAGDKAAVVRALAAATGIDRD